ncbi:MAG TPA: GGDEF domain-containing protein [Alkalispirochaeta sp.]|nr:GGDEF domain-containing protein [Alkalispirochaeta sp.]
MRISTAVSTLTARITPSIPRKHHGAVRRDRFARNTRRIFIIGLVLGIEQAAYGVLVAPPDSVLRVVYFATAIVAAITAVGSHHLLRNPPDVLRPSHRIFEYAPVVVAMTVALIRTAILSTEIFRLPTVYIAIIYVVAVAFLIPPGASAVLYLLVSVGAIVTIPQFHPTITQSSYVADIVSNGALAWIIATIIYRSFLSDFVKTKTIEEKSRELEHLAIRDRLTNLFNRRKLDSEVEEVHAWSTRYEAEYSVIIVDIDHFKLVNDSRGHHTGDLVLQDIAGVLADNVREVDTCGRWGGEEFLIICPETDLDHARALAERLRSLVEARPAGNHPPVTASFGVAASREARDAEDLIRIADDRLYLAKELGRNRVESG